MSFQYLIISSVIRIDKERIEKTIACVNSKLKNDDEINENT